MQADGMSGRSEGGARYRGLVHAVRTIVKEEGVLGMWKGVEATCTRASVLAAAELSTYDEVRSVVADPGHTPVPSPLAVLTRSYRPAGCPRRSRRSC